MAAVAAAVAFGCSSAPRDARIGITEPDRAQFDAVGLFLGHRCGSLDCHGSMPRNLIVYGCEGLRLNPSSVPGCRRMGGVDTTREELDATYRSVLGLEPAVMSSVVRGHGENPELLSLVRKARGSESHKGGALVVPGDAQDVCITSWLAGATDTSACTEAMAAP